MNIYFNELTLDPIQNPAVAEHFLTDFFNNVLPSIRQSTGIKLICCNDKELFKAKCTLGKANSMLNQMFYSTFHSPYVDSDIDGSPEENRYQKSEFVICKDGKEIKCHDLGCAVLKKTITVGFPSEPFWQQLKYQISERADTQEYIHDVLCITMNQHISDIHFVDWVNATLFSEPKKVDIEPEKKKISLRDDHGYDILMKFAQKVRRSPYVLEIVNSLPFCSSQKTFIDNNQKFEDGLIEIRLHWSDKGFGMVVKTTGKNKYQTKKIAEILTNDFDQRR